MRARTSIIRELMLLLRAIRAILTERAWVLSEKRLNALKRL